MTFRPLPPLSVPDSITPLNSTRAQWNILRRHLRTISADDLPVERPHCLHLIDRKVIIAALIMERAELDLLESETKHFEAARTRAVGIQFPSYHVGFSSKYSTPGTNLKGAPPIEKQVKQELCINIDKPYDENTNEDHQAGQLSPMSPLSPTFGPRRDHVFSGTMSRRRSIPHHAHFPPRIATASSENDGEDIKKLLTSDQQRRIQWEAAWAEIELNLDRYIERLTSKAEEGVGNEKLWDELVRLSMKGDLLEERIRSAKEDLRG